MDSEFVFYVIERMAAWAPVEARAMFGGFGLYREEVIFAIVVDSVLYFRTDAENQAHFEQAGCDAFVHRTRDRAIAMPYREAPADALDDSESMALWAQSGYEAARRVRSTRGPG